MTEKPETQEDGQKPSGGISWRAMLFILLGAILVAAAVAYRLIFPFFHQQP
ncbi:MAG: hypothetical protein HIU93_03095 [Acidobacteria bacterium]|nr:hypothetical protein [Acidobacteriota bacterium]